MASPYEVEVTIESARDLKNVNWRNGPVNAYAVVWIDPSAKVSTKADIDGDTNPTWSERLIIPLGGRPLDDAILHVDIVHAGQSEGVKPLIGSAKLQIREVLDEAGMGGRCARSLKLKRPSGRPHGKVEVKVKVSPRDQGRYNDPYAPPYGQTGSRDPYASGGGGGYGQPYAAPPPSGYPYGGVAAPPSGYPYGAAPPPQSGYGYGAAPAPPNYSQAGYGPTAPSYGPTAPSYGPTAPAYGGTGSGYGQTGYQDAPYGTSYEKTTVVEEKKSKFGGMGTGLAVGAVGGLLGGLAIYEGAEFIENKVDDEEDKIADRVEDDVYEDDDY